MDPGVVNQAWRLWLGALRLTPDIDHVRGAGVWWPVLVLPVVAGIAAMVGQSAVLAVNRIRGPARAYSLVVSIGSVLLFHVGEAAVLWALGRWLLHDALRLGAVIRIVLLSTAPLVFGFLIVIPLLGPIIDRLLAVWSFLVIWTAIMGTYRLGPVAAGGVVFAAWFSTVGLGSLTGPLLAGARDRVWRRLTGRPLHPDASFLLDMADVFDSEPVAVAGPEHPYPDPARGGGRS